MAKGDLTNVLVIAALLFVILAAGQNIFGWDFKGIFVTAEVAKEEVVKITESALCPPGADPSNTMTIGPLKKAWNPTDDLAGCNSRVFKVSQKVDGTYDSFGAANDEGNKDDGAAVTVGGLDKIGIIYAYDNLTFYSRYVDFTAPCRPFSTGSFDAGMNELIANASSGITTTIKNSDTSLDNPGDGTNNETIGSGEYGYFDFTQLQTAEHEGISATDGGYYLIVVEQNGSMYDETKTKLGSLSVVSTPAFYIVANVDSVTTTFKQTGCPLPGDGTTMCQQNLGRLTVKAETGVNPTGGSGTEAGDVGLGDIKLTYLDAEWYLDTTTGAPKYGYQKDTDRTAAGHYGSVGVTELLRVN